MSIVVTVQQLAACLLLSASLVCAADLRWAAYIPDVESISGIAIDNADTVLLVGTRHDKDYSFGSGQIVVRRMRVVPGVSSAEWSMTIDGPGDDSGGRAVVDNSGNVFVTGTTQSGALPGFASDGTVSCPCSFLTRVQAATGTVVWTKVWPGTGTAIALGPDGGVYVAHQSADDAFVRKLNLAGALVWQKQFGGSKTETPTDLALTATGDIVVTGSTNSPDFPTTDGAYQRELRSFGELPDQFVTKFTGDGSRILWSTYFGYQQQRGYRVGLDALGNVYVTGYARDSYIPTNSTLPFALRALLAKFTPTGSLSWIVPIGDGDLESSMLVTPAGDVWLAGMSYGPSSLATSDALQDRPYSDYPGGDALIVRIDSSGQRITYGTFLGGTDTDFAGPIALDGGGNVVFAAHTDSEDFPITQPDSPRFRYYIAKLDLNLRPVVRISSVADAASYLGGPLVPGEIVTVYGYGLGPATGMTATPANGKLPVTLGGTTVKVNGIVAPLLYSSDKQVNAIVPSGVTGIAKISLCSSTGCSNTVPLATAPLDITVFTQNGQGYGGAAALNQDGTLNSAANPARRGSVVQVWATGTGPTNPPVEDGSISTKLTSLANPIGAYIGGAPAAILYSGAAPGLPSGVVQINLRVPQNSASGEAVLSIGRPSTNSGPWKQGVTVFVQ